MNKVSKTRNQPLWKQLCVLPMMLVLLACVFAGQTQAAVTAPFEALWSESGHADATAEAFIHWDGDGEIKTSCAKCHSSGGFQDFLDNGVVDAAAPLGTTVDCVACHNSNTTNLSKVVFPSGEEVTGLGAEARCITCHQGRESSISVDIAIAAANLPDDDTIGLGFKNVHYMASGATQYGSIAMGGYQYAGKVYDRKFAHIKDVDTCIDCHDPHTLNIKVDLCNQCHEGTLTADDCKDIRYKSSGSDYDGDGNTDEGIAGEIDTLAEKLYAAIQANATLLNSPIGYESHSYPYWFKDTNADGVIDTETEAGYSNGYKFTARLLRAAYNYQFAMKDHGAYAHNAKYLIQLLFDSIEDLNAELVVGLIRNDSGHFDATTEAFRHWDADGGISASCSKCHSSTGLPYYLEYGKTSSQPISNGLACSTCHVSLPATAWEPNIHSIDKVEFPSGLSVSFEEDDKVSNVCLSCHQGRESTASVNAAIADMPLDVVSSTIGFKNAHYYPAGATLFGSEAKTAYEYAGRTYKGQNIHGTPFGPGLNACHECHDSHKFTLNAESNCDECHGNAVNPRNIRIANTPDFDGDRDIHEGIAHEIDTMHHDLFDAIQDYATNIAGTGLVYSPAYPYYFRDTNGNGVADDGEGSYGNKYNQFTPRLLQAVYNYQFVKKDPGAFAHNPKYVIQILYDSIASLAEVVDVDMTRKIRPNDVGTILPECGDIANPAPVGDVNGDCRVDLNDLGIISGQWLLDLSAK